MKVMVRVAGAFSWWIVVALVASMFVTWVMVDTVMLSELPMGRFEAALNFVALLYVPIRMGVSMSTPINKSGLGTA